MIELVSLGQQKDSLQSLLPNRRKPACPQKRASGINFLMLFYSICAMPYINLCAYHFSPLNLQAKTRPRMPHSATIATHTPRMPKPSVMPRIYPRMTRNSHIDSRDETEVKLESPAARRAAGRTKLSDHRNGWAIAISRISPKMVGMISAGGENIRTISGNNGNSTSEANTNNTVDNPRNDLMNFLAS